MAWQGLTSRVLPAPPAHAMGISGHFTPCCALGKGLCVCLPALRGPGGAGRESEQQIVALSRAMLAGGSCVLPFGGKEMHPRLPGVGEPLEGLG